MTFGEAVESMKKGKKVTRSGWNGKGMWLIYMDKDLDGMVPVPKSKTKVQGSWLPFIAMKTVNGKLVPWLASQTDILAEDWGIVE